MHTLLLTNGWQVRRRDPARPLADDVAAADGWLPASAPGTVHQDLLAAGAIPDPFVALNEREVQWVGEADWLYRSTFDLPPELAAAPRLDLCFDGLDTFATVWLNGEQVLASDNMFVPRRLAVAGQLRAGGNQLCILFESALRRGRERETAAEKLPLWNGDSSRLYVRKAQYHYGWDWGPTLLTAGPWRTIRLEGYAARVAELACPAELSADLASARLPAHALVEGDATAVRFELFGPDGALLHSTDVPVEDGAAAYTFTVASPALWWPRSYGGQPLYRLAATASTDRRELRLGLRRLRLVQEPLDGEAGASFFFEVNNTPIFCGGANWIPADSFTPRVTPERYRAWIERAIDANLVMLRVWGGGIYEDDTFYDLCDEAGLLVWQDFMFACGLYPADPAFQAGVRAEAEAQVRRLRHHPCIALWCGNNEDYLLAGLLGRYDPARPPEGDTAFPARTIYERLLPDVCAALDPARPYWPGSPYGGADPNDPASGDRHTWDIWHGLVAPYQHYVKFGGRFVSEFGMQAAPVMATIAAFMPPGDRNPFGPAFEHHNKAPDGPRRLAVYLSDNLPLPATLDDYVYSTQLIQAEALTYAVPTWRRGWGGPGRYASAGALVWQLNDCWPVTSWALVDYYLRPKPAYYALRRGLAPLALGLAAGAAGVEVWAVNGTLALVEAELELRAWTLDGALAAEERRAVALGPNQATELGVFGGAGAGHVVGARLVSLHRGQPAGGEVLARAALWPQPLKYLPLRDPGIRVEALGGGRFRVSAARPAKGVWLAAGGEVEWSDNMLDVLPGDPQEIAAQGGAPGSEVKVHYLQFN